MKSPVLKIAAALLFAALAVPFFFGCAAPAPATDCAGITRPGSYSELFSLITARTESETVKALAGVTSDNFGLNHAKGVNFDFSASSGSPTVVMPDRFVSDGKVLYSLYSNSTFSDCYGTYSALTVTELSPDSPDDSSTYFFCGSLFDISSDPGLEDQQIIDVIEPEGMFLYSDRLVVVGDQLSCRFSSEKYASLTKEAEKAAKKCYEKVEHYFPGTFEEYLEAFLGAQDVDGDGKRDGEYFGYDAGFYRDIVDCCDSVEKRACAFVFDVSNPYKPVFLSKCGVGGSYSASACSGGSIRLISNFVSCDPVEDSLKSFVPHVLLGGVESPVDFSQVAVTKNAGALGRIDCYTVLTIDPSDASVTDSLVVYSDCEGAYFTENDLFTYNTYIKSERVDGAVSESLSRPSYTDVFRISFAGG
ncbi:MAG: beta-propeller domain-containing protein, partial [Clostridia bacterium]|nr:beta-propeller domain-containing protein [Clostridia bacterium]